MKKLLLSLACLFGIATINAQDSFEVKNYADADGTFVEENGNAAAHYQPINSFKLGAYQIAMTKGSGSTEPALYGSTTASGKDTWTIRAYTGNTLTVTAPEGVVMTQVDFKAGSNGTANAAHTVDTGALSGITSSAMTWKGSANAFTITFAKNARYAEVVVYTEGNEPEPEPEPERAECANLAAVKAIGAALENKAQALYTLNCSAVVVFANGAYNYVYDGANYALIYKSDLNLEAGDKIKSGSTGYVTIFSKLVELVPDAVEVESKGNAVPEPTVVPFDDLNAEIVAANQDKYIKVYNVEVTSVATNPFSGIVTQDDETYELKLYKRFNNQITAGTYNMTGFISIYNTDVQIYYTEMERVGEEPEPEPLAGEGEGTLESPYNVARALDIIAKGLYTKDEVYLKGIVSEFTSYNASYGSMRYYISDNGETANQLYVFNGLGTDGAKLAEGEIKVGDNVVIKGALTLYNSTPEVAQNNQIVTLNGNAMVETIISDNNAPVEYFNLQGMRVANPSNGIYIRRQGSKAVKVMVK